MKFIVDHTKLKRYFGRVCPCLFKCDKTNIKYNVCPCQDFIQKAECRCNLFIKVEE